MVPAVGPACRCNLADSEWIVLGASETGTSHEATKAPCLDSHLALEVSTPTGPVLVAACSDGAGSAARSEEGSKVACAAVHQAARAAYEDPAGPPSVVTKEHVQAWFARARDEVERRASELNVPSRDLACTLLVAVVSREAAVFGQVGDGCIVVREGDQYTPVLWPDNGEYANTTTFVTDTRAAEALMFTSRAKVDEIALMTDGLQRLALRMADRSVQQSFFAPFFKELRATDQPDELYAPLLQWLRSPTVNARTDDDKTLVLAIRRANAVEAH